MLRCTVLKRKKNLSQFQRLDLWHVSKKKKLKLSKRAEKHRVRYGLDYYLDLFLDNFFRTILKGGGKHTVTTEGGVGWNLSVLREGWEAECYYSGMGERRTITTQGGVEEGCNSKHYRLMELLLDRTNFWFAFAWQKNEEKPRLSAKILTYKKSVEKLMNIICTIE